jgi:hypothetical protein
MEVPTMQARLETKRFPAAAVAIVFAVLAIFLISAGSGYAVRSFSAPAVQKAPAAVHEAVQGGPMSDLTRALPQAPVLKSQGGPQSDLTRVLPRDTAPYSWGGPQSDLTRALPGQQSGGDSSFDTCTRLVHKVC